MLGTIEKILRAVTGFAGPVTAETKLAECGDNLEQIEFAINVEDRFGFEANNHEWQACKTIGDVLALVGHHGGKA